MRLLVGGVCWIPPRGCCCGDARRRTAPRRCQLLRPPLLPTLSPPSVAATGPADTPPNHACGTTILVSFASSLHIGGATHSGENNAALLPAALLRENSYPWPHSSGGAPLPGAPVVEAPRPQQHPARHPLAVLVPQPRLHLRPPGGVRERLPLDRVPWRKRKADGPGRRCASVQCNAGAERGKTTPHRTMDNKTRRRTRGKPDDMQLPHAQQKQRPPAPAPAHRAATASAAPCTRPAPRSAPPPPGSRPAAMSAGASAARGPGGSTRFGSRSRRPPPAPVGGGGGGTVVRSVGVRRGVMIRRRFEGVWRGPALRRKRRNHRGASSHRAAAEGGGQGGQLVPGDV